MRRGGANMEQRGERREKIQKQGTQMDQDCRESRRNGKKRRRKIYRGNTGKQKKRRNEERRAKKNRGIVKYKEQESRIG